MDKDFEIIDDEEGEEPQLIETIKPVQELTNEEIYIKQFNKANFKQQKEMEKRKVQIIGAETQKDWKFFELTIYTISSWQEPKKDQKENQFVVERRYSDFEWLYSILKKYFQGFVLPKPPQKDIKAKIEFIDKQKILEERQEGFIIFLQKLLDHPKLRYSNVLYLFLKQNNEEFLTTKEESNVGTDDLVIEENFITNVQSQIKDGFSNVFNYITGHSQDQNQETHICEIETENMEETNQFEKWEQKYNQQKNLLHKIKDTVEQIMIQRQNEIKKETEFYDFLNDGCGEFYFNQSKDKQKIVTHLFESQKYKITSQDSVRSLNTQVSENLRHLEHCVEILAQRKILAQNIQQQNEILKTVTGPQKPSVQNQISLLTNRYRTLCWQFKSDHKDFENKLKTQLAQINKSFTQFIQTQNQKLSKIWQEQ
ncbi:Phox homologous domain [Pseudocohnilembus persalinus]|uniref:Phox homologous domain n=1 Tax=Pseudocohnilembus persalinus TaxID=266149 RepID=A0A0V0R349_PSEPJ|nr:Phox homologous domain [Pseudocohnilembus persalinus]|eukprot:KRX08613.1 Phox homologous domain [Pseudocohnilembus persalinus]